MRTTTASVILVILCLGTCFTEDAFFLKKHLKVNLYNPAKIKFFYYLDCQPQRRRWRRCLCRKKSLRSLCPTCLRYDRKRPIYQRCFLRLKRKIGKIP